MSTEHFIKTVLEENKEELEEIRKLAEIMDQLRREETKIYVASVTSNL
jgi:beta-phosphoglucomutase-like phosphatase (HAD superfamily)